MSITANSENFSLRDFIQNEGSTLDERVSPFAETLSAYREKGWSLYSREIVGAPGPRVQVRDPMTSKVNEMVMMGSNDYLGFTHHPKIIQRVLDTVKTCGIGMGGPPLLNGTSSLHRELELKLARLKHAEDAILFSSGYQANLGWTTSLFRAEDVILYDELNHASFFDGLALARSTRKAKAFSFLHNNVADLQSQLEKFSENKKHGRHIFVMVEGVYSMDGDLAPLKEIAALCKKFEASLIVDDAHGTGLFGKTGAGAAEHFGVEKDVALSMGTFSKVFGVTGGFVTGPKKIIDYLRYFSRSYVFSAHLPQMTVAAVLAGLEVLETEPDLRAQLHRNVDYLVKGLRALGIQAKSESAIVPVLIPQPIKFRELALAIHQAGLFVNPIEYPAVSLSEQRLRLSVMATHQKADLDFALGVFKSVGAQFGLISG